MKFVNFIVLIIVAFFTYSCEDLFQPEDENLLGVDYAETSPAFAEGILLNAYNDVIGPYSFSEAGTDDAVSNQLNNGYRRISTGELTARYNPASRWNKYQSIFYINKFIPMIDVVEWSQDSLINSLLQKRLLGEALALRALMHFYVLEAHAGIGESGTLLGVPYYEEFIEPDGNFNIGRLSFVETVNKINTDFDQALNLLPMDYSDESADVPEIYQDVDFDVYKKAFGVQNELRISGRIIKALKARVALLAASPAYLDDVDYYTQAANLAAELINDIGGIDGLDRDGFEFYDDDFDIDLTEILWRASTSNSSYQEQQNFPPSLNGDGNINPSQNLVDAFPTIIGYPIDHPNSLYNQDNPLSLRDPRLKKYILVNGGEIGGKTINTGFGGGIDRVDSVPELSTRTGYYLKKLLRPDVIINNDGSVVAQQRIQAYIRYTELFLILAESANEIGGPNHTVGGISAYDVVLALRNRARIVAPDTYLLTQTTKEQFREIVRTERRIELCFEGFRFWDLRRWNEELNTVVEGLYFDGADFNVIQVEDLNYSENAIYMPIPNSEVLKFSNLEQNQGW